MRPNKVERRKELECAIALRQKEMEELQRRKSELEEALSMRSGALAAGDLAAAFPVLDYCGARPRKDVRQLPIEHVGTVMTQFDIALKAITQYNHSLQQQIDELNRRIKTEGQRCAKVKQNTKLLADTTGCQVGTTNDVNGNKLLNNDGEEVTVQELERRKAIIEREIKAGQLLIKKKEKAILSMSDMLQERQEILDEINALNNEIRVTERDTRCEEEALQELNAEHAALDAKLNAAMQVNVSSSRQIIQKGIEAIKDEIDETVNGTRRGQERVIKAQDYRIEQLERRLECIQKALQNNNLVREVDSLLSRNWESNGELVLVDSEADMYDLEKIIPAQEKCHPVIYKLLLAEEERLSRRIETLNTIVKEKEDVIDALACKVEALSRECQKAIQELDQLASGAAYEEEKQRIKAMEYIQEQRLHYSDLFFERQKLKSKALATSRKAICK
ncbi:uncharacterized protein TM35_000071090 [Trypanosoma theileri]|uniref:Uncharacterized protein n=1 Tax=Trypanosoma theileri TaxID=67003 RepID=A0A1X0P1A4_9TRYP|nr:uncharacterized protein TM35_000071090 [Trypanosoma theileri]ORC90685.1 hypothetical protein TM35_000071090 [Trypanosoma theileri]